MHSSRVAASDVMRDSRDDLLALCGAEGADQGLDYNRMHIMHICEEGASEDEQDVRRGSGQPGRRRLQTDVGGAVVPDEDAELDRCLAVCVWLAQPGELALGAREGSRCELSAPG
jgi:hypothetical protein